ncbi:hypothetical protein ACFX1Z_006721 [Malus domestica]
MARDLHNRVTKNQWTKQNRQKEVVRTLGPPKQPWKSDEIYSRVKLNNQMRWGPGKTIPNIRGQSDGARPAMIVVVVSADVEASAAYESKAGMRLSYVLRLPSD